MSYFNGQRIDDDFQQQEPVKQEQQERTFTLQDMLIVFDEGFQYSCRFKNGDPYDEDKARYFKEQFGIDITPKQ